MKTTQTKILHFDEINRCIASNIDRILKYFGVEYYNTGTVVTTKCPIHSSSRPSLNIFLTGDRKCGNFVCWTKHCESDRGDSSIYLIQAMLEKRRKRKVSILEAVSFLNADLSLSIEEVGDRANDDFLYLATQEEEANYSDCISREMVRGHLQIPARYYINRGFRKKTLDYFDVGTCYKKNFQMYGRVVVPVYDNSGNKFVGCVARSQNEICPICECYHLKNKICPTDNNKRYFCKWMNSNGFRSANHLYGLWKAKDAIQEKNSVILVEGQGDVWKSFEAGKRNVLGLFGDSLKKQQLKLLNKLGVYDVYLALDNDNAGRKATEKIESILLDYFNVYRVQYSGKDIGETEISELRRVFKKL